MVAVKGPWKDDEENDPAYLFGMVLGAVGIFTLAAVAILALSWPLSWLWNLAAGPFGIPQLIWYELAAGWVVMIILVKFVKKITGN